MKRFISALILFGMFANILTATAVDQLQTDMPIYNEENKAPLDQVLVDVKAEYPNAQITVSNGAIQVYVSDSSASPFAASSYNLVDRNGGCWREFTPPFGTTSTTTFPYACIYLPKDEASATYYAKTKPSIVEAIADYIGVGISISSIPALIKKSYNVPLTTAGVTLIYLYSTYSFFDALDTTKFSNAYNGGNAVRMMLATNQGWPLNVYSTWDGVNVNPDPYSNWKPAWHSGEYYYH